MENEIKKETIKEKDYSLIVSIVVVFTLIVAAAFYTMQLSKSDKEELLWHPARFGGDNIISLQNGVELKVKWGDMGVRMVESGVIDKEKFEVLYSGRGGLSEADKKLLFGNDNGNLVITSENSGMMLNMLWALGLGNKNTILETGEMMNPIYGGAGNFASTGGWTLSKGNAMDHYSMHQFFVLTDSQQTLVDKVSRGIYRPCCGNSTHFPDCNHGMAMLGLLELMASQGASEEDMWNTALIVNSYWFSDVYSNLEIYMKNKGVAWQDVNPQEILGINYSSSSGYQSILAQMEPQEQKGGASCGT